MVLIVVCAFPSFLSASYNSFENWGFEQGGGFRQGNFAGQDGKLVVLDMALDQESGRLAVAGALGDKWAVRVYEIEPGGPVKIAEWNGGTIWNMPLQPPCSGFREVVN